MLVPSLPARVGAGQGALPHPVPGSKALSSWTRWAARADPSPPQAMRTLSWKHTLGLVTMDVELADRTLSVAVTPVQAVVLLYFQDQGEPPTALLWPRLPGGHRSVSSGGWVGPRRLSHAGPGCALRVLSAPPRPQPAGRWRS